MANAPTKIYRGSPTTTLTTVYTVPTKTTTIITNIVISNTTAAALAAQIRIGGQTLVPNTPVPVTGFLTLDITQVMTEGETLQVQSSGSGMAMFISGVEVA
uniref:Minor tail protein n=1 Tax=Streptomyces phage Kamino TaxID=3158857 RepID=A0AAU7GXA0_9CAUD